MDYIIAPQYGPSGPTHEDFDRAAAAWRERFDMISAIRRDIEKVAVAIAQEGLNGHLSLSKLPYPPVRRMGSGTVLCFPLPLELRCAAIRSRPCGTASAKSPQPSEYRGRPVMTVAVIVRNVLSLAFGKHIDLHRLAAPVSRTPWRRHAEWA